MAEGGMRREQQMGEEDTQDGSLLHCGDVSYSGRPHRLHLMHRGLRLLAQHREGDNRPVLDVTWRNVLCACEPPIKKSKSSQKAGQVQSPSTSRGDAFVLHYIEKNTKNQKLKCKSVTLETAAGSAEGWIMQIEEKRKGDKPQKLLIVINPIGGSGTARQTFEKQVQPVFALAGVELVVKVTERAKQAVEIARTFDVSSVDGVISMGGDGLYMEILHGLIVRKQEEEGVDLNNPDTRLVPPTVRVGIIPAGTGNGVTGWYNGVIDVTTATLNIVRGQTQRASILSIHEPGKLLQYAGLLVANGFFSKLIKRSDDLRWMKRGRYAYVLFSALFGKKKLLDFDIEILKKAESSNSKTDDAKGDEAAAAADGPSEWTKVGRKTVTAIFSFAAQMVVGSNGALDINPFGKSFDLMLTTSASVLDHIKFMIDIFTRKTGALEKEYLEHVADIQGLRFQLAPKEEGVGVGEGAGAGAACDSQVEELARLLDVDGEMVTASVPTFDIRLHPQFLQVFCVPERGLPQQTS